MLNELSKAREADLSTILKKKNKFNALKIRLHQSKVLTNEKMGGLFATAMEKGLPISAQKVQYGGGLFQRII